MNCKIDTNSDTSVIGLGVIGLGVMGATHVRCINALAARSMSVQALPAPDSPIPRCVLAAVCDRDPARRTGIVKAAGNLASITTHERLFDPSITAAYAEPIELLEDPRIRGVHICTPTDTHVEFAVKALEAGKHVLIEKPVAVAPSDVRRVMDAAERAGRLCMPAMCMRFWPGWAWVRERIVNGEYGAVRSATFHRLGTPPSWSPEFYRDSDRTGGALVDLHIHDADFIRWCFGEPDEVVSTGSTNHLSTIYRYAQGPGHVVAEGGWGLSPGFGFRMRYTIAFDCATAEFDLGRTPTVMLYRDGKAEPIEFPPESAYHLEIEHFVNEVGRWEDPPRSRKHGAERQTDHGPTLADAVGVARLLEAERRSLHSGRAERVIR